MTEEYDRITEDDRVWLGSIASSAFIIEEEIRNLARDFPKLVITQDQDTRPVDFGEFLEFFPRDESSFVTGSKSETASTVEKVLTSTRNALSYVRSYRVPFTGADGISARSSIAVIEEHVTNIEKSRDLMDPPQQPLEEVDALSREKVKDEPIRPSGQTETHYRVFTNVDQEASCLELLAEIGTRIETEIKNGTLEGDPEEMFSGFVLPRINRIQKLIRIDLDDPVHVSESRGYVVATVDAIRSFLNISTQVAVTGAMYAAIWALIHNDWERLEIIVEILRGG